MKKPSINLVHVLIAKSIIETLFVAILVVVYFLDVFPHFHGWGDVAPHAISGWAVNSRNPSERVEVQLFVDEQFVARAIASQSRRQVVAGGWAKDEWHGFVIPVSGLESGFHVARVYAVHSSGQGVRQTLQLLGHAVRFQVGADGTLKALDPADEQSATVREGEY
ncbi:MAG TPA: hypothetical protein VMS31_10250 [Pyrinomonadaceae bacterium]|nr:hypothetical protein [Pyrinomonadaceae bacterium]